MEEDPPTPFWVQPSSRRGRNGRRQQRDYSSIFMSSGVLVAVLILAAVTLFLFFVIPSVVDLARRTFKASLVRRGWDWVNLVLVLFAIVCGFLGRKDDDDQVRSYADPRQDHVEQMREVEQQRGLPSDSPKQWYEQSEKMEYRYANSSSLKRTSSSYPDLRLESRWIHEGDWPRSFDDTYIDGYDQLRSADRIGQHHRIGDDLIEEKHITEDLEVQTIESRAQASLLAIRSSPFLATASRSKSSRQPRLERPSTAKVKRKARQELEPIGHEDRHNSSIFIKESDRKKPQLPTPPAAMRSPPPPPPPPPPPLRMKAIAEDDRGGRSDKKRGGVTKDFLTSLYQPKKRKQRQKQKRLENLQSLSFSNPTIHFPSSSAPPTPPPPPPPPPRAQLGSIRVRPTNRGSKSTPENPRKETLPTFKKNTLDLIEDYSSSRNNSPSIPIPPPPPPPPFKTPPRKFVNYNNIIESFNDSPPPDYSEEEGVEASSSSSKGTIGTTTLFCPSPDVNIKADDFITRFRAKLKLERLHSINKKLGSAVSPLGQDSSTSPSPSPSPVWMRDSL